MPDWLRHVLGVLGLAIPLSILFYKWQSWSELIALWTVIGCGGGALLIAFLLESLREERAARIQSEAIQTTLMDQVRGDHDQSKPS